MAHELLRKLKLTLSKKAEEIGCQYFDLKIGRSSASPYLIDENDDPFSFNGQEILPATQHCETCNEPITAGEECSWCQINDELRQNAASRNPYRILNRLGLLDSYVEEMDAITYGRKGKNKK